MPDKERVQTTTRTTITLAWSASRDNVGVLGYGLYLNGRLIAHTRSTTYIYRGLSCGTTYRVGLVAYDAAGNRSNVALASGSASTQSCNRKPKPKPPPSPTPTPTPPPASGTVAAYLSPAGSDGNRCTRAAPCQSLSRGYQVAARGAVVELAAGTYASGRIAGQAKGSNGVVTFRPAPGARVTVDGELRTAGQDHMEFQAIGFPGGVYISGASSSDGSDDITIRSSSIRTLFVRHSNGFRLIGGDVGGTCDATSGTIGSGDSAFRVQNVLIDGVRFHDITRGCKSSGHVECLFVQETSAITIQNTSFSNCDIMDVFFHAIAHGKDPDHVKLLNNTFGRTGAGGSYSIIFRADSGEWLDDYVVRGNTFSQPIFVENASGSKVTGFYVCGNTGDRVSKQTGTEGFSRTC